MVGYVAYPCVAAGGDDMRHVDGIAAIVGRRPTEWYGSCNIIVCGGHALEAFGEGQDRDTMAVNDIDHHHCGVCTIAVVCNNGDRIDAGAAIDHRPLKHRIRLDTNGPCAVEQRTVNHSIEVVSRTAIEADNEIVGITHQGRFRSREGQLRQRIARHID